MDYIDVTHCLLCGMEQSIPFENRVFKGYPLTYQLCRNCGLVFQSPRMTDKSLDDFYKAEYRLVYQGLEEPTQKDVFVQENRSIALGEFIKYQELSFPEGAVHLDIGCSTGILLRYFSHQFKTEAVGIEPGNAYRSFAAKKGLQVYADLAGLGNEWDGRINLVSLIHVLEHLPDPVGYLSDIRKKYLAPQGYLLVEVPNLYAHDSFEVAHLTAYSPGTLLQTLRSSGFEILRIKKHGSPRSNLLPLYLTVLGKSAGEHSNPKLKPELGVQVKRKAGLFMRRVWQRLFPNQAWLPLPAGDMEGTHCT